MFRLRLALRVAVLTTHLVAASALVLALAGPAHAGNILINNGLAPPNPTNVIDDDRYSNDSVYARNGGCGTPESPWFPCSFPGTPTELELTAGGTTNGVILGDTSSITVTGGYAGTLHAHPNGPATMPSPTISMIGGQVRVLTGTHSSTITVSGGAVDFRVDAWHYASVTISGGSIGGEVAAFYSNAVVEVVGSEFAVDGIPVPFGDLTGPTGRLTGSVALGGTCIHTPQTLGCEP
jgi:hypothetical protein